MWKGKPGSLCQFHVWPCFGVFEDSKKRQAKGGVWNGGGWIRQISDPEFWNFRGWNFWGILLPTNNTRDFTGNIRPWKVDFRSWNLAIPSTTIPYPTFCPVKKIRSWAKRKTCPPLVCVPQIRAKTRLWALSKAAIRFIWRDTGCDSVAKFFAFISIGYHASIPQYIAAWGTAQIYLNENTKAGIAPFSWSAKAVEKVSRKMGHLSHDIAESRDMLGVVSPHLLCEIFRAIWISSSQW